MTKDKIKYLHQIIHWMAYFASVNYIAQKKNTYDFNKCLYSTILKLLFGVRYIIFKKKNQI